MSPTALAIGGLFFLSGAAGLVYQVLFMRSLGLFFGSDLYGVSIVLAAFMGGMALGSLAGGYLAERSARPLLGYGLLEIGIGIAALLFQPLLATLDPLLRSAYAAFGPEALRYLVLRTGLAAAALLVPTALMGATLPLVLQHLARSRTSLGATGGALYAVNTLGALAGTLAAGFALLPYLGMARAIHCAAALNLGVGAVCCALGWRARLPTPPGDGAPEGLDPLPGLPAAARLRVARAALVAFAVSGFGSFALEVVWTRVLLRSTSATVYSFAAMLACFLFGIFLGSALVARRIDRHPDPIGLFAALEVGAGACVGVLCLLVPAVPGLFGALFGALARGLAEPSSALVAATLCASFLFLVVPTTLLGATFAVALRGYTRNVARVGSRAGILYGANTLGAIGGSLAASFWLLPALGTRGSLALLAALFAANGVWLARSRGEKLSPRLAAGAAAGLAAAALGVALPYRVTLNLNQRAGAELELLHHAEGVQNTVDVVRSRSGVTSLVIGGNVEADDALPQRRHFVLKGHLPLLFLEEPRRVLVIGLGMGITLRATLRHPGVLRVDLVELSPEIVAAQEALRPQNDAVLESPLLRVHIDDGRHFLRMTDARYDMITADPIHPKVSRVGYLYTREYYEAVRARLAPGGVVCQWMPLYQIAPRRLRSAVATFTAVFPGATLWYVESHALLVAGRGDAPRTLDWALLSRRFADPALRADLASVGFDAPEALLPLLLLGPEELRAFAAAEPGVPLNTDDHPYLEYFVPGDLFRVPRENLRALLRRPADPTRHVRGIPPAVAARVRERLADRPERLLAELAARRTAGR